MSSLRCWQDISVGFDVCALIANAFYSGGENRWLPAKPPTPWEGEYPALTYGPNCPQRLHDWSSEQTFLQQRTDGWQSEDMLKANVWTPSLTGKRPVMFYIHGGGLHSLNLRNHVTRMATMKCNQKCAPVFTWYFTWQSPMLEDAGAWHTAELAFCFENNKQGPVRMALQSRPGDIPAGRVWKPVRTIFMRHRVRHRRMGDCFDNTKRCEQGTGNGPEALALARAIPASPG
jgi:carboxylesterase type B